MRFGLQEILITPIISNVRRVFKDGGNVKIDYIIPHCINHYVGVFSKIY